MPPNTSPAAADQGGGLAPGVSFFQVLEPAPLLAANGMAQYGMVGPFLDLARASAYANTKPGSLITVTLVLHQASAAPAIAATAVRPFKEGT